MMRLKAKLLHISETSPINHEVVPRRPPASVAQNHSSLLSNSQPEKQKTK